MIGLSLRLALALGLHLRNEDSTLDESRKDARVHVWWSLHAVECLLSTITGRPPSVAFEYCTVPLPYSSPAEHWTSENTSDKASYQCRDDGSSRLSGSVDQSTPTKNMPTSEHYHISRINISLISQRALLHLYSPLTANQSWEVCPLQLQNFLNSFC